MTKTRIKVMWRDPDKQTESLDSIRDLFRRHSMSELGVSYCHLSHCIARNNYHATKMCHIVKYYEPKFKALRMKGEKALIVLHFKDANREDEYFSSVAKLYDKYSKEDLGIVKQTLYNALAKSDKYSNRLVIVSRTVINRTCAQGKDNNYGRNVQ